MENLIEHLTVLTLKDGTLTTYGLPHKYIESVYPEIDWGAREAIILSPEYAEKLLHELAYVLGYEVRKEETMTTY